MSYDAHTNFGYSTITVPPVPAASGTSLTVADASSFPIAPFNCTVWPTGTFPLGTNAEIIRVTAIVGNVLTILRTQEGSSARTIVVGDQIAATITAKTLTDVETASAPGGAFGTIQFNDAGTFGGITGSSWDGTDLSFAATSALQILQQAPQNPSATGGTSGSLAAGTYYIVITATDQQDGTNETLASAEITVTIAGPDDGTGSIEDVTCDVLGSAADYRVYVGTGSGAENQWFLARLDSGGTGVHLSNGPITDLNGTVGSPPVTNTYHALTLARNGIRLQMNAPIVAAAPTLDALDISLIQLIDDPFSHHEAVQIGGGVAVSDARLVFDTNDDGVFYPAENATDPFMADLGRADNPFGALFLNGRITAGSAGGTGQLVLLPSTGSVATATQVGIFTGTTFKIIGRDAADMNDVVYFAIGAGASGLAGGTTSSVYVDSNIQIYASQAGAGDLDGHGIEIVATNAFDDGMMTPANGGSILATLGTGINGGSDGVFSVAGAGVFSGSVTASDFIVSGSAFKTDTVDAHVGLFQAYDVNGAVYKTFATLTNGNTPSFALSTPAGGTLSGDFSTLKVGGTDVLTSVTGHNLLSATHPDTTAGTVARGDLITGQGASAKWVRLAKGTANQVLAMDGTATDILWVTPASGTVTSIATTSPISGGTITSTGTLSLLTNVDFGFTAGQTITAPTGATALTLTGGSQNVASFPVIAATQTWNNSGVTFTGLAFTVTDTASAAASLLMDLKVGSTSEWKITKGGATTQVGAINFSNSSIIVDGPNGDIKLQNNTSRLMFGSSNATILQQDGANDVLALRRTTNPQRFNICNTFTSASVREDLSLYFSSSVAHIGTTMTGATARVLQLDYGGTTTAAISVPITSGNVTFGGGITLPGGATFLTTNTALTDGAGASAGTLGNAPAIGNPTKWIGINDNGTTRYIPAW